MSTVSGDFAIFQWKGLHAYSLTPSGYVYAFTYDSPVVHTMSALFYSAHFFTIGDKLYSYENANFTESLNTYDAATGARLSTASIPAGLNSGGAIQANFGPVDGKPVFLGYDTSLNYVTVAGNEAGTTWTVGSALPAPIMRVGNGCVYIVEDYGANTVQYYHAPNALSPTFTLVRTLTLFGSGQYSFPVSESGLIVKDVGTGDFPDGLELIDLLTGSVVDSISFPPSTVGANPMGSPGTTRPYRLYSEATRYAAIFDGSFIDPATRMGVSASSIGTGFSTAKQQVSRLAGAVSSANTTPQTIYKPSGGSAYTLDVDLMSSTSPAGGTWSSTDRVPVFANAGAPPPPPPPPPPPSGPFWTDYRGANEPTSTLDDNLLVKNTNIVVTPGSPGRNAIPSVPPTPARSYTVEEVVCTSRLVAVSGSEPIYGWITPDPTTIDPDPQPQYMIVDSRPTTVYERVFSCQATTKTVFEPASPGIPGVPGIPGTPTTTTTDYNLGWNAGARSMQSLLGSGYVEFIPQTSVGIVAGLNNTDNSGGYGEITHGWYFTGGVARVFEAGVEAFYSGPFVAGADVFKIERLGATVRYFKNGVLAFTSSVPSTGVVFLDTSMYSGGDTLFDSALVAYSGSPGDSDSGMLLPAFTMLGYSGASYATANMAMPAMTIAAGVLIGSNLTMPALVMMASDHVHGSASLELPMLTLEALSGFTAPMYALGTLIMPAAQVVANGLTGQIGTGSMTLRAFDMIASEDPYGEAVLTLPALRMTAHAYEGNSQAFMFEFMLPQITLAPQKLTALVMTEDMTVASLMSVEYVATAAMDESLTIDGAMAMARQRLASMFSVVNVGSAAPVVNAIGGATGPGGVAGDDPYHPDVRLNSDVQVWAMDWDTAATTAYENYSFNSFAVIDGKAYGAKADGVYLLNGTTDSGVPVRASVNFGANDFGTTKDKAMPHAYVGVAASGQLYLRVQVDGGTSYTYQARSVDAKQQVQRFDFGKGLKGSYYTFELFNKNGADFDLDKIEFMPVVLSRRI